MGQIPCYIIITCGAAGAAASTLALVEKSLAAPAHYLAGIESEICELGDHIAPYLSEGERESVIANGERADVMRQWIVDCMRKKRNDLPTASELWEFAEAQRLLFFNLADKHKRAPSQPVL